MSGKDQLVGFLFSDLRMLQVANGKVQSCKGQNLNNLAATELYKRSYDGACIQLLA